jgi:uncharacterized Fe-S center protein
MTEYMVTTCPEHGTTATGDKASATAYAAVALACATEGHTPDHIIWHVAEGTTCWSCCDQMSIHNLMGSTVAFNPHAHV